MAVITILGAGAMGAALAVPAAANGHDVRLWGTWLDDDRIAAVRSGRTHPGTGEIVPGRVASFLSTELPQALEGADVVILAVTSAGVVGVTERAAPYLGGATIAIVSKGFHRRASGEIVLLPGAVREVLSDPDRPIVAIGGPCKANEVAAARLTAAVFASSDRAHAEQLAGAIRTRDYLPSSTSDEIGVEICAPLKNVYAIALGIADGMGDRHGVPWHNLKSALFAQSITEMSMIVEAAGGDPSTAYGLSGVGDLEVTALSGRNSTYGRRIGAGETASAAREAMWAAGETVEGIGACEPGILLAAQYGVSERIPLLRGIAAILEDASPHDVLVDALAS